MKKQELIKKLQDIEWQDFEGDFDYYKIMFYLEKKTEGNKRVTEKVTEKVTENQSKIIAEMQKKSNITVMELKDIVGISRKSILENIAKLKAKHIISRIGPDKGGHWEVM